MEATGCVRISQGDLGSNQINYSDEVQDRDGDQAWVLVGYDGGGKEDDLDAVRTV